MQLLLNSSSVKYNHYELACKGWVLFTTKLDPLFGAKANDSESQDSFYQVNPVNPSKWVNLLTPPPYLSFQYNSSLTSVDHSSSSKVSR